MVKKILAIIFCLAALFPCAAPAAADAEREALKDSLIQKGMTDEEIELRLARYDNAAAEARSKKPAKTAKAKAKLKKKKAAAGKPSERVSIPRLKVEDTSKMSSGSRGERSVNAKDELPKFRRPGEAPGDEPGEGGNASDLKKAQEMMKSMTPEQRVRLEQMMKESGGEEDEEEPEPAPKTAKTRRKAR